MENSNDKIIGYYDDLAADYDRDRFANSYGRFIDAEERKALRRLGLSENPSGDILEIACGTGRLTGFATVGLDGSSQMMEIARRKYPGKKFVNSDARSLPFDGAAFDCIFSFHLMMHLDAGSIATIMSEAARVLRPGGRFIFDLPSRSRREVVGRKAESWHGSTALSVGDIRKMAEKAGLRMTGYSGLMFIPVHRIPKRLRQSFVGIDSWLSRRLLRRWSSYQLFTLVKD